MDVSLAIPSPRHLLHPHTKRRRLCPLQWASSWNALSTWNLAEPLGEEQQMESWMTPILEAPWAQRERHRVVTSEHCLLGSTWAHSQTWLLSKMTLNSPPFLLGLLWQPGICKSNWTWRRILPLAQKVSSFKWLCLWSLLSLWHLPDKSISKPEIWKCPNGKAIFKLTEASLEGI